MKIIRAQEMGMCFGVRDALQIASSIADPREVTVYGELVHNPEVKRQLEQDGFQQSCEQQRSTDIDTPLVLITAHGISNAERARLKNAGKQLIDTTCPLVRRVHEAAMELQKDGRHVLLIGKAGHVEVRGITEDLRNCDVIEKASEASCYESERLGIVCQTTMPPDTVKEICLHIQLHNPLADIRIIDTVCRPTRLRQQAILELIDRVDAVVVVGGRNSNNTQRLVNLCCDHHTPAMHVERAEDLREGWFTDLDTIGLTAGTSTLDKTIDDVHRALEEIARNHKNMSKCHA